LARTVSGLGSLVMASEQIKTKNAVAAEDRDEIDALELAFNDMGRQLNHAVNELRDNQRLLQSILDNSTALIFVKDLQGRYLLANRRFEELFHIQRGAAVGKMPFDLFPSPYAEPLHAVDRTVIRAGQVTEAEQTVPQDDGLHTYISIKAPLFDEHGKVYAMCTVATDITERKRTEDELKRHRDHLEDIVRERTAELAHANLQQEIEIAERKRIEQALRRSEQFLDSIVDNIPNMIFVKEAQELRFARLNKAGEDLLGCSREEFIGKKNHDLFPKEEADFFEEKDRDVLRTMKLLDIPEETVHTRRMGTRILHTKKLAIQDGESNARYLLGISEDITERKQLEDLLRQRNAELLIAKEQADVANQAKSTFLTNMSHELRTPLNAILGYAQILSRDNHLRERQKAALNTIQQSGEHLLNLITDLLDLSKIEAGKLDLDIRPFDLPVFVRVIADIIRIKAEQKNLVFHLHIATHATTIMADEKRLRQVLLNLLGNAVKFTDQGEVRLCVRELERSGQEVRLRFEIQDIGIGIRSDQLEVIFNPFEQVGDMQRRYGGSGLGLSISRHLVRLMGSDIQVASQLGMGSRFWFDLALPVETAPAISPASPRIIGYRGQRRKLLIATGMPRNRTSMVDLLRRSGMIVHEVHDGHSALMQSQDIHPDLIMVEMELPLMGGIEVTRRLRQLAGFGNTPVIALSANTDEKNGEACLAAGASAIIADPVDPEKLLRQIGELLNLSWIYAPDDERMEKAELAIPPKTQLEALHELAKRGNMRDIRLWAEELESLDEGYRAFSDNLRRLSDNYQSKAILELVEQCLEREKSNAAQK
jgi:PAS domain S-box-containing protein